MHASSFSRRRFLAQAALGVSALPLAPTLVRGQAPAAAVAAAQGDGHYGFQVGEFRVDVVSDGALQIQPVYPTFGIDAPSEGAARAALRRARVPQDSLQLQCSALLVRRGSEVVVIDAGCASAFGPTAGQLATNLAKLGLAPEDVTAFIATHAHPDHVAGAFDVNGGLVFPKARVFLSEEEHAFWTHENPDLSQTRIGDDFKAIFVNTAQGFIKSAHAGGKLEVVAADAELFEGLRLVPLFGHTPGHVGIRLSSGGQSFEYIADAAFLDQYGLSHPGWSTVFDTRPAESGATAQALLARLSQEGVPFGGCHFGFPSLGYAYDQGDGSFDYLPVHWQWQVAPIPMIPAS